MPLGEEEILYGCLNEKKGKNVVSLEVFAQVCGIPVAKF